MLSSAPRVLQSKAAADDDARLLLLLLLLYTATDTAETVSAARLVQFLAARCLAMSFIVVIQRPQSDATDYVALHSSIITLALNSYCSA